MGTDDAAARKERAASIRRQVEAFKTTKDGVAANQTPPSPETPVEFVHRRMQELEVKAKKRKRKRK